MIPGATAEWINVGIMLVGVGIGIMLGVGIDRWWQHRR